MSNLPLADRIKFIGASEVADLFGIGFKSLWQLWLEKKGRIEPEDLSQLDYIQAGKFLEPAIAEWAAYKWDMKLRKVHRYIPHPTVRGFGASLDYESQEGALVPVEIKWSQSRDGWVVEGDTLVDAPFKYLLQTQAQMSCTGSDSAWLVAMLNGKLYSMRVMRHEQTINRIITEVDKFWQSIDENKEPKPDFAFDGSLIASFMNTDKTKIIDLTDNNHLPILCAEYQAAASQAKDAEARKETALAEIRVIIGDASKAITNGYTITNTMVEPVQVSFLRKGYPLTRINLTKEGKNDRK